MAVAGRISAAEACAMEPTDIDSPRKESEMEPIGPRDATYGSRPDLKFYDRVVAQRSPSPTRRAFP